MTYKFGSRIENVEDRLNEFLELVRRYDEANGIDPVPDQLKKACIISNTPEPLKTHLQLNVSKLGTFDALRRLATEDFLRSRRILKTTSAVNNTHEDDPMPMSSPGKGKAKENPAMARKVARKAKRVTLGKVTENRKWNTRALMVSVEIAENTVARLPIVGTNSSTNLKAKVNSRASRNPTSLRESDAIKQAEETWSPNTSLQPSSFFLNHMK